jgi:hypothetical protein
MAFLFEFAKNTGTVMRDAYQCPDNKDASRRHTDGSAQITKTPVGDTLRCISFSFSKGA